MPGDTNDGTFADPVSAPVPDDAEEGRDSGVEPDQEDGVDPDQEDPNETRIENPFDPEKIKVTPRKILVDHLVSRISYGEIDLAPDFQRRSDIWNQKDQSRLVESLLLRIPLPVFYVAENEEEKWAVVDGLQRMSAINRYVRGEFHLSKLQYLVHLEGKKYGSLKRPMQRRINETELAVNVIEPETPDEVMFNIFHRLNTGGMKLNGQEIRHAMTPGPIRGYLEKLSQTKEFLDATNRSIKPRRMDDRDCVLRFLAFHIDDWERYAANDIDGYLTNAMKRINNMTKQERDSIAADFRKAMRAAADIFGEDAFRKLYYRDGSRRIHRGRINKALFGAWSVGLARRSRKEISRLVRNQEGVRKGFMALLRDDREFERAISYSTSMPARVRKQFQAIDDLIGEWL